MHTSTGDALMWLQCQAILLSVIVILVLPKDLVFVLFTFQAKYL